MKIIFSRLVKDSEWAVQNARQKWSFPLGVNYTMRKQARSWLLGWAKKNKMSPGNIRLPVSTAKGPWVSSLGTLICICIQNELQTLPLRSVICPEFTEFAFKLRMNSQCLSQSKSSNFSQCVITIKIPLKIHIMVKSIPLNFQDLQAVNRSFRIPSNFYQILPFKFHVVGKFPLHGKTMS